jgi:metal-responsive CopG/Arc/MetJ family transcriptional regulator
LGKAKIAITLEEDLLARLDELVAAHAFASRSGAVEQAVEEKLSRIDRSRLARECAKLDQGFEQQLADEGISGDLAEWPEY